MTALEKVIAILEAFLVDGEELRLSDLCAITGLSKSTVYVIAHGLIDKGYLTQSGKRGTYFLGVKFIEFADVVKLKLSVKDVALPFMRALCEQVNETVELVVRDRNYAAVVESVRANRLLSASGTGKWAVRIPLNNTACGKALAAYASKEEWQAIRETLVLLAESPRAITSLPELEEHLALVREQGFAVDDEEAELGIRSVAAPVRDAKGDVIAAIDIIGPKLRLTDDLMRDYTILVQECAADISRAFGYVEPVEPIRAIAGSVQ